MNIGPKLFTYVHDECGFKTSQTFECNLSVNVKKSTYHVPE